VRRFRRQVDGGAAWALMQLAYPQEHRPAERLPAPACCSLQLAFTKVLPEHDRRYAEQCEAGSDARQTTTFSPFVYINNPTCVHAQTLAALSLVEDALILPALAT
jgi:hypothetical protein